MVKSSLAMSLLRISPNQLHPAQACASPQPWPCARSVVGRYYHNVRLFCSQFQHLCLPQYTIYMCITISNFSNKHQQQQQHCTLSLPKQQNNTCNQHPGMSSRAYNTYSSGIATTANIKPTMTTLNSYSTIQLIPELHITRWPSHNFSFTVPWKGGDYSSYKVNFASLARNYKQKL